MIRSLLLAAVSASPLVAQGDAKPTEPKPPMIALRALGVPELVAQFPDTKLGKLAADEEVAAAIELASARMRSELQRRNAIRHVAAELEVEIEPWMLANMYTQPEIWRAFEHPLDQLRSAELTATMPEVSADIPFQPPNTAMVMTCLPPYLGKWEQAFRKEVDRVRRSPWFEEKKSTKIGDAPAFVFAPPELDEHESEEAPFEIAPIAVWMQCLPGTFAYGAGILSDATSAPRASQSTAGEVSMMLDLEQYVAMFSRMMGNTPTEFSAMGFDTLRKMTWRGRFEGEMLLDELTFELSDREPTGIVGALLLGKATPPSQGLPKGAIAQLRTSVDVETLTDCLQKLQAGLPAEAVAQATKALDGGVALGVCAPKPGGLIPRIYLSFGVADKSALDKLLATVLTDDLPTKKVKFGDVECATVKIPGAPPAIQPAFCIVDGAMHIAESARSLRSFLKAQREGVVAMDTGDAPLPTGPGEIQTTFDLRLDEVQLYRSYYETWLPLFEMTNQKPTLLDRDDMPSVDVIEEHCGTSRGALYRDGNRFVIRHLGVLGGPEAAAIAMTWGPILSQGMSDYTTQRLSAKIAEAKLATIWEHFERFEAREKRKPKDLAELVAVEKMPHDLLSLPADDMAEDVTLVTGAKIKSSFRYFPEGVKTDQGDRVIMIEIRPVSSERGFLGENGAVLDVWGDDCTKPIGQFR